MGKRSKFAKPTQRLSYPLFIARRYLFARRSANAINIITGISVLGITIGAATLVLVLSVFNGFEGLIAGMYGYFNPEIKITPRAGKTFQADSALVAQIAALPEIETVSATLEEIAFFEYGPAQDFGVLKGVDDQYVNVTPIRQATLPDSNAFALNDGERYGAVVGAGMRYKLGLSIGQPGAWLNVYMPAKTPGALDKPFRSRLMVPNGLFSIQQEVDNQYVLTDIELIRELLEAETDEVSALELRCVSASAIPQAKKRLRELLGDDYHIKDRYEQNEALFKVMRLEKWIAFGIVSLMLALLAFNMVGALWMLALEKQRDIAVLKSMGATDRGVFKLFVWEGMLLTLLGLVLGLGLALFIYFLQKRYELVTIPDGFLVSSYPIELRFADFLPIVAAVLFIGLLASLLPAWRTLRITPVIQEY